MPPHEKRRASAGWCRSTGLCTPRLAWCNPHVGTEASRLEVLIGMAASIAGGSGKPGEQWGVHGDDGVGVELEGVVGVVVSLDIGFRGAWKSCGFEEAPQQAVVDSYNGPGVA